MADCSCYRCTKELCEREPFDGDDPSASFGDPRLMRMFCCDTCGNKRCPHAADHRLDCTGSNAPGQAGSLYESTPTFQSSADASHGGIAATEPQALYEPKPSSNLAGGKR